MEDTEFDMRHDAMTNQFRRILSNDNKSMDFGRVSLLGIDTHCTSIALKCTTPSASKWPYCSTCWLLQVPYGVWVWEGTSTRYLYMYLVLIVQVWVVKKRRRDLPRYLYKYLYSPYKRQAPDGKSSWQLADDLDFRCF